MSKGGDDDGWCPLLMWRLPKTEHEWSQLQAMTQLDAPSEDEGECEASTERASQDGANSEEAPVSSCRQTSLRQSTSAGCRLPVDSEGLGERRSEASLQAERCLLSAATASAESARPVVGARLWAGSGAADLTGLKGRWAARQRQEQAQAERMRKAARMARRRKQRAHGRGGSTSAEGDDAEVDALAMCVAAFGGLHQ